MYSTTQFDSIRSVPREASEIKNKFGAYETRHLFWLLTIPFLALAGWESARFARADYLARENTTDSVREAVRLDPGNAEFREIMAEHFAGDGRDPNPELRTAVSLDPLNAHWWERLGFQEESEGNYSAAEQDLQEALRIDRTFGPRWALMNYYFRRGNQEQFWIWAKPALEMSFGDRTNIFRLCWLMTQDEAKIRQIMPVRKEILDQYLSFLDSNEHLTAAAPIALQVAEMAESEDLPVLNGYWSQSIGKDTPSALAVWNILCRKKLLSYAVLDPAAGRIVTNGEFSVKPMEAGFDWREICPEGASTLYGMSEVRITLNGKQPEDCVLLTETIPLLPGHQYRLNYRYQSEGEEAVSGLSWYLRGLEAPAEILGESMELRTGSGWNSDQVTFNSGNHNAANLELHYKRPSGKVRWQGEVAISAISSEIVR